LLRGQGYGAIRLTVIGSFFGLLLAIAIAPFFMVTMPFFYPFLIKIMAFLLIAIALFLIFKEQGKEKKFWAFFVFMLSGILGLVTLNFPLIKQPLFPLFSGLFGISLLSISFLRNVKLPEQKIKKIKVSKIETIKALIAGIFSGSLVSFLPGVGAAQAAVISTGFGRISEKAFLIILGAINTIVMCLSLVALYSIGRPRTGSAVIIGKFIQLFSARQVFLLLAIALVAGSLAVFITLAMSKIFIKKILKINYKLLCLSIIVFIFILTPFLSGLYGLLILIVATAIGITTSLVGIRKMHLMGCLLLPVILWYLPF